MREREREIDRRVKLKSKATLPKTLNNYFVIQHSAQSSTWKHTKVMEINVRYDTTYDIHVAYGKNAFWHFECVICVPFRCICVREEICMNEITKNDRLHFVLNISFVFILVIVIITFDLRFCFFFIYFSFNRYQFYINCKQFSVCTRQPIQRSLRTWPLC